MAARAAAHPPDTGTAPVAPVTIVVGEEEFLVDRAVKDLIAVRQDAGLAGDVHDVDGAALGPGELDSLTSPSLFGGGCVLVVRSAQDTTREVAAELVRYVASPAQDVSLILTHAGGAKGKELLASVRAAQAQVIECPKVTRFAERLDFVRAEFRRAGKRADDAAARALLDAVGSDLRELAAACDQLAADATDHVDEAMVATYYRGRAEATGFTVADRAVEGHLAQSLEQLRWALATGVSPVLICSALAQGVRLLGRVGTAPRSLNTAALAAEVGAPPWKIDRVRQQLRGWEPEGIARALHAVAEADAQVKGETTSAGYALERAIRRIVAARSARSAQALSEWVISMSARNLRPAVVAAMSVVLIAGAAGCTQTAEHVSGAASPSEQPPPCSPNPPPAAPPSSPTTVTTIGQAYSCVFAHYYAGPVLDDRVLLAGAFAGFTQELDRLGMDQPDATMPALTGDRGRDWDAFAAVYQKVTGQLAASPAQRQALAAATMTGMTTTPTWRRRSACSAANPLQRGSGRPASTGRHPARSHRRG